MTCRCSRPVEADRALRGRKTCATCSTQGAVRWMRRYHELVAVGLCGRCAEPLDPKAKSKTTCAPCREVMTITHRERKHAARTTS
jgi:hypothetical protein